MASRPKRPRKKKRPAPRPASSSRAHGAREWIDVIAYGAGRFASGVVPVGLGALGGLEYMSPDTLSAIHMSPDMAQTLFWAALTYLGVPVALRPHSKQRPDAGERP
jgi:hypothetical protein